MDHKNKAMKDFNLKQEQFTVNIGGKNHKVEVFFYEQYGQAYEVDGVTVDGKDVTEELFIIEDLLGISIMELLMERINGGWLKCLPIALHRSFVAGFRWYKPIQLLMSILKKVEYFRRSLKEELTPEQIDRLQITFHDIEQQKMPQGSKKNKVRKDLCT